MEYTTILMKPTVGILLDLRKIETASKSLSISRQGTMNTSLLDPPPIRFLLSSHKCRLQEGRDGTGLCPEPSTVSQAVELLSTLQCIPQAVAHSLYKSLQRQRRSPSSAFTPSSFPLSPTLNSGFNSPSPHIVPITSPSDSSLHPTLSRPPHSLVTWP